MIARALTRAWGFYISMSKAALLVFLGAIIGMIIEATMMVGGTASILAMCR